MSSQLKRREQADLIIKSPNMFKICLGCNSIINKDVHLCVNCHSYNFNRKIEDIVDHANVLGNRSGKSVLKTDME